MKEETHEVYVAKVEENADLEEPALLLDQENLGCSQQECKTYRRIVEENRKIFES